MVCLIILKMQSLPNQENLKANTNGWEDNTKHSNPTIMDSLQTLDAIVITVFIIVMFGLISIIPEWFVFPNSEKYEIIYYWKI
jgi:hypothetical protein